MTETLQWTEVAKVKDVLANSGACIHLNGKQIALFHAKRHNKWFATQNLCPHKKQMVLSRGYIGDSKGELKLSCPLHKKSFSFKTGKCLSDPELEIKLYPIKVEGESIFIQID